MNRMSLFTGFQMAQAKKCHARPNRLAPRYLSVDAAVANLASKSDCPMEGEALKATAVLGSNTALTEPVRPVPS